MARKRLTAAAVDRIQPPRTGQIEVFDTLLPSFGLRLSYSGSKSWIVMTRINGRQMRITIGRTNAIPLAEARQRAREIIDLASRGIDPRSLEEEKRQQQRREENSTFERAAQSFMDRYVLPNLRASTAREYRRILFGDDTAAWRQRPVSSISKADIRDLMDRIDCRGTRTASRLALAYLRKFFNWCADNDLIEVAPSERVRPTKTVRARERVLSLEELRVVWQAFEAGPHPFGPLFKVLVLTGQRRGEVAGMRWDELHNLDRHDAMWAIPASRTKNHRAHIVPLSSQTREIIRAIPRIGDHVFTTTSTTPVSGFSKAKARVDAHITSVHSNHPVLAPWTLHDLRRTVVTRMSEDLAVPPHVVEAIVNHVSGAKSGVAGTYNRALYLDERRAALDRWSALLMDLVGNRANA